ncbi:ankyrin-3-like [Branchiostoma floridae]|uniref:Ankyrin-3-like n=1 Tax=Branchiostoma floridae TaxID=7739 RepID=A0A9J7M749_BRAFL|nr:ankyrin-3-like [Branchiostoma floridae]
MSKKETEREKLRQLELSFAAREGDIQRVTRFIKQGVDVNCSRIKDTPLHNAAIGGHVGVAELLLKYGALVDSRDTFEATPLHCAATGGHVGVVELLLKVGAWVDCRDVSGDTPLHKAASGGHVGVAELLLKAGARVGITDRSGETPLHEAASGGHVGVVELLLKAGAQLDSEDRYLATPLNKAASGGHVGVAELLLEAGARVDSLDGSGETPLHAAASGGHVGVAELLLKYGAQVDSVGLLEATPLHTAASGGHVGVAELLLKAGARVDRGDVSGETPEDIAAREDVPNEDEKDRILEGRKRILELFAAAKMADPYRRVVRKLGPGGGELQTGSCTVTVPPGAVTMETEITYQVINPNDVTIPLKDGDMLMSDIIELGPHGTTFHQPVTVQMQYSSMSSGGDTEAVMWVTEDRSQWTELTTIKKIENKLSVLVDHFSIFAVISQPRQDQFTVSTEGCILTSSTLPAVEVKFPEGSVNTETQVTIQVQEVSERAVDEIKAKDESFRGLLGTSPIVKVETVSDSAANFHKPVTVRVPYPQHCMNIQHEGGTKLKVMSCEEGTEDWVDVTDSTKITHVTEEFVEFEVNHFTRWIVIVIDDIYRDKEVLGQMPLHLLCKWLQHRAVQFILLQRKYDMKQVVIECKPAEDAEVEHTKLLEKGYEGPLPSDSEEVSTDWKDLAFHLGLKRADIANIAGRNPDDKSRCMDMLQKWKKLNGDAAATEVLMKALSEAGLQSVVDGLDSHLTQMGRHG